MATLSESQSMMESMVARELAAGQMREQGGTLSSTTSDLGSSMERSTQQVAKQAQLVKHKDNNAYRSSPRDKNDNSLTLSADSAVVMSDESPPKTQPSAHGFKMRSKSAGADRPIAHCRPHSIADLHAVEQDKLERRAARAAKVVSTSFAEQRQLHAWLSADIFARDDSPSGRLIAPIAEAEEPMGRPRFLPVHGDNMQETDL